jgi:hypothetical protein
VGVTERLGLHPRARLGAAGHELLHLAEPTLDVGVVGAKTREEAECAPSPLEVTPAELLERLTLQGRLLRHEGPR